MDFDSMWQNIVDNIPDKMTMDEYKNYILGFVFYRYLCEKQEQYLRSNNVIDVAPGETLNDAFCTQAAGDAIGDYIEDISASLGYAIEPYDTWGSLVQRVNDGRVIPEDFQNIFEHFNKNAVLNKDAGRNFADIFDDVKIGDTRLGSDTNSRAKTLCKLVKTVDKIGYENKQGEVFRELIGHFAGLAGKTGGKFYTPQSVSKLMAKIIATDVKVSDTTFSAYDFACGSGSTLLELKNEIPGGERTGAVKYYGEENELTTYNLARMNLFINGISSSNIVLKNADTLGNDWPDGADESGKDHPRKFDAVLSDIEFSKKWDNSISRLKDPRFKDYGRLAPKSTADYAFLLHGLYHLGDEGTMAIIVPHGVLFRGKAEEVIRKNLINHPSGNRLYAVIGLPENIMFSEKGKKAVAVVILVLKKNRKSSDVLFIDASNDFEKGKNKNYLLDEHIDKIINAYKQRTNIEKYAYVADYEELERNDFNLNIPRYVNVSDEDPAIDLEAVCNFLQDDEREIEAAKKVVRESLKELGLLK